MDTKGIIQEHSKVKLELYRLYLERYLSVLLVTPFFESIVVSDVFAGCGVSKNEEKGSALISAETIEKIKIERNPKRKPIFLNLNDSDQANCSALQTHLQTRSFVKISNQGANQYIQTWMPIAGSHNLFFIDPHGYTQVSIENLKRLFSTRNCDFLIFIPIYHIYRFLRKEEESEQLKPIANFLLDLGIHETSAIKAATVDTFADLVVEALQAIAGTKWVYKQMIENRSYNSKYCLFFITRNILGAEKFLEAQSELERSFKVTENETQASFDFVADIDKKSIRNFIKDSTPSDNISLYERGIESGILPKDIRQELKKLEETNRIEVVELPTKKRNKRGFYLDYKYYKTKDRIISIIFKG